MKYIPTIGLEIHAELATKSKMFCSCKNDPDEERPNANICPICMGHPGTLPVLNTEAIRHVLKIGLALGGERANFTEWDRKNYFYPDIPKGYQISQYKYPLIKGGGIAIGAEGKSVAITRIHLEEDTAQSTHDMYEKAGVEKSLVNFNRAGVPLMELVTEPVIHDAVTAVTFAKELQLLLRTLGAGEANLEKGEMRVEANISMASEEDTAAGKFGTKTEVKNLNSFRAVERAIAYEIERQTNALGKNEKIIQETRGWDESAGKTFSQRAKESSHDYRYFPDPDIPKMRLDELAEFAPEMLQKEMPELPAHRRLRLKKDFEMTDKEAAVFVESGAAYEQFEKILSRFSSSSVKPDPALVRLSINYFLTDYVGILKKSFGEAAYLEHISLLPSEQFAELMTLTASGKINSRGTKDILAALAALAANPKEQVGSIEQLAEKRGLIQKSDTEELKKIAQEIISANPKVAAEYKSGKTSVLQFFVGQAMKATKGSANPAVLQSVFVSLLS